MASWMIHFRVAQALLDSGSLGNTPDRATATAFAVGNVAPDSGVPTPDGQGYTPDKTASHFMRRFDGVPDGQNSERCDPALFAEKWLKPVLTAAVTDPRTVAFYLGYLSHLVTDNAWVRDFIYPAKARFADLRLEGGVETPAAVARFYAFLKKDWYDMDFLYLKHRPDLPAYRLFLESPYFENRYLPFFPEDAFEMRRAEIELFYRKGVEGVEERETYLNEGELEAFVLRVSREIVAEFGDFFEQFARAGEVVSV